MIVTRIKLNAQIKLLEKLDNELDDLKEDLEKVQAGWNVDGITYPSDIEEFIKDKRKEIEVEEVKLAGMEAVFKGVEATKPKHWEVQRSEVKLCEFGIEA